MNLSEPGSLFGSLIIIDLISPIDFRWLFSLYLWVSLGSLSFREFHIIYDIWWHRVVCNISLFPFSFNGMGGNDTSFISDSGTFCFLYF